MTTTSIQELEGKVAIVTGAAGGIGEAVATLFAERGAYVVAEDIKPSVVELEQRSERIAALVGDVAEESTAQRAVALAIERFGRVDILNQQCCGHSQCKCDRYVHRAMGQGHEYQRARHVPAFP